MKVYEYRGNKKMIKKKFATLESKQIMFDKENNEMLNSYCASFSTIQG